MTTAGRAGWRSTNDQSLYRELLVLRNHGMTTIRVRFVGRDQGYEQGEPNPWYYEMQALGLNFG